MGNGRQVRWQSGGSGGGTTSPLTTKGDLWGFSSTVNARLPVGADGTFPVANSGAALGIGWRVLADGDIPASLSGKTLVTPTIASFVNATHNHQNAAGGGTLDAAAIATGTLNNAQVNWAAPGTIGSTTPNTGAFTTLSGLVLDAATATVTDVLTVEHDSSGTPGASFGTGVRLKGHSSTNTSRDMAHVQVTWITATDSTRSSQLTLSVFDVANERLNLIIQRSAVFTSGTDGVGSSVTDVLNVRHNTTATPAANFGTGVLLSADTNGSTNRSASHLRAYWSTAADASRKANAIWSAFDTAERDAIGIGANGTVALLGFYSTIAAAPIVQPTTGIAAATFVANTSGIANDTATFDGYTIGQIVKIIRNLGLAA